MRGKLRLETNFKTQIKKIAGISITACLIIFEFYFAKGYFIFFKTAADPASYLVWQLSPYIALILMILIICLNRFLVRADIYNNFRLTRIWTFAPLYTYCVLAIGLKQLIIILWPTDKIMQANSAICFGFMLFSLAMPCLAFIAFTLEFIMQFKKEPNC